MKNYRIYRLLLLLTLFCNLSLVGCQSNATKEKISEEQVAFQVKEIVESTGLDIDSIWLNEFVTFRDALYRKDLNTLKSFIDFPIRSENIWYLAYSDMDIQIDVEEPFTEKHFDKTYDKIFSMEYTDRLLKVKSKELFKTGAYETHELKKENVSFKIYSDFDKTKNILRIQLNFTYYFNDDENNWVTTESAEIFEFKLKNNKMKWVEIYLAG